MPTWADELQDFAFLPNINQTLDNLANLAEVEDWEYLNSSTTHHKPVLINYLRFTYKRLIEESKIEISDNGQFVVFNTGLVTANQEAIFALFKHNYIQNRQPWHFQSWCRKGQIELTGFSHLPEMAHYFDDPTALVLDVRKELRANIEHIIADNKDRFPEPYRSMDNYTLQTFLKGAIDNSLERARRNYRTAIPQYYKGKIQLLLPLCISNASRADLAIVVEDCGSFYRASTCLTLDMAYGNARLLTRPDKDWLQP